MSSLPSSPLLRASLFTVALASATGCVSVEEDYFLERMPEAICLKYDECGLLAQWSMDPDTCMLSQALDACGDGFEQKTAGACLDDIAELTCEDLERPIEDLVPSCFETCSE
jgi:hypothetical protein